MSQEADSCKRGIYPQVYQSTGDMWKETRAQDLGPEPSCKDYGPENDWGTQEQC